MFEVIDDNLRRVYKMVVLWGYGWKRRKKIFNKVPVTQWCDPQTGLWYKQKTAIKLLKVQAMDQLKRK